MNDDENFQPTITYKIVRKYKDGHEDEIVERGLTREEAKKHCSDKESSSR